MSKGKHLLTKTVSLFLCASLLVSATVIPVFAAKSRVNKQETVRGRFLFRLTVQVFGDQPQIRGEELYPPAV